MNHPLDQFEYCPQCGAKTFLVQNEKAKKCATCGFVYYFNPSAAVACFIKNQAGELLVVRRSKDPAKGTLDLPGGFVDMHESAEDAIRREIQEETNLNITACCYLFSIPNIYRYAGFDVHTLDLFFECTVTDFEQAKADDDAAEIVILRPEKLSPDDFGLTSIKEGIKRYLSK